jgi:hypothetical protein
MIPATTVAFARETALTVLLRQGENRFTVEPANCCKRRGQHRNRPANKEPDNDKDRTRRLKSEVSQPNLRKLRILRTIERDADYAKSERRISFKYHRPFRRLAEPLNGGFGPHPPEAKPRQYGEVK